MALATHAGPTAAMWLPQLRKLCMHLRISTHVGLFNQGLLALSQLETLSLADVRPGVVGSTAASLPNLQRLPRLRELVVAGSVPAAAWACPHLTSLLCGSAAGMVLPHRAPVRCTALRQLMLRDCTFAGDCSLTAQLGTLAALTSLAVLHVRDGDRQQWQLLHGGTLGSGTRSALPPSFSQLRRAAGCSCACPLGSSPVFISCLMCGG